MEKRKVRQARRLRRNSTPGEELLWSVLRNRRFGGEKFRRQHPIGPYIVDFCCPRLNIVIELDGDTHAYKVKRDQERSEWITRQGYRIIRFTESQVSRQREGVLKVIWEAIHGSDK